MTLYYFGERTRPEPTVTITPGQPVVIGKTWWVKLRYASGYEVVYPEKSELNRRILIEATAPYAVVVETGESE